MSDQALRFTNCCHWTERQAKGAGTAIHGCRGMGHNAVPVLDMQHLEATARTIVLADRLMKFVVACLSSARPLIESELNEGLSR